MSTIFILFQKFKIFITGNKRLRGFMKKSEIILEIDKLVNSGISVNDACSQIAENNVALLLKYKRWYMDFGRERVELKNEDSVTKSSRKKTDEDCQSSPINILQFKNKQNRLTEKDLQGLFMGVLSLIRRSVLEEAKEGVDKEKQMSSYLLKKALVQLNQKDEEIAILKEKIVKLEMNSRLKRTSKTQKI